MKNAGSQYECKPYPYSGWCNGAAWAYGPGTGTYWQDAWILKGTCTAGRSNVSGDNILVEDREIDLTNTDEDGLALYPNPAKNSDHTITLNFDQAPGTLKINMKDLNGSEVHSQYYREVKTRQIKVELPQLPQGLYFIRINADTKSWMRKYLIEGN